MADPSALAGIRQERLDDWFAAHIAGAAPPLRFARIEGGHSNLTFRVEDAGGRVYVLRRPPLGELLATAHDMAREHLILRSLAPTPVPVPPVLGLCEDRDVNDAPFYVMAWVDGNVLDRASRAAKLLDEGGRRRLGEHVIEVLAQLHAVDPDAVGLGRLGRREGYLARQLKRWRTQWERSKTRELPAMERVAEALEKLLPQQIGVAIVHGDYRIGNMLSTREGRVAAVLDWELCTLGDPLADVGYILNNWVLPGETAATVAEPPPTAAGGFPDRERFVARYAELTGRDVSRLPLYRAFQYWRSGAIVEGVLARYLQGKMAGNLDTDLYSRRVEELASAAQGMIEEL